MVKKLSIFALVLFLCSTACYAYIAPVSHVISSWARQTKSAKTLQIQLRTRIYDSSFPNGSTEIDEYIWIQKPSRFRRSRRFPNGRVEHILNEKQSVRVSNGTVRTQLPKETLGLVGLFYLTSNSRTLESLLSQAGIDMTQNHWLLDGREPMYELGNSSGDRIQFLKHIWVPRGAMLDRETFQWFIAQRSRFGIPFPETIDVLEGNRLKEQSRTVSVKTNLTLGRSLFDPKVVQDRIKKIDSEK